MARKQRRKPGDLAQLWAVLWRTIIEVGALLDTRPPSNEVILKSAPALVQLVGAYRGILEVTDLDKRLTALERRLFAESNNHHGVKP